MDKRLLRQFSLDYCCSVEEVADSRHHFTEYTPLDGRRLFDETQEDMRLKIAALNGKLLVTGRKDIVRGLEKELYDANAAWFMEADSLTKLSRILAGYGVRIRQIHPFYIAEKPSLVCTDGYEIRRYGPEKIAAFRGDPLFSEAFAFNPLAPDVLGVAAFRNGSILGMAGASQDSPFLWQIGINVLPGQESKGVGSMLVSLLKNDVLERGPLPYYGTALSHIASQRVALHAGFLPMWTELLTCGTEGG